MHRSLPVSNKVIDKKWTDRLRESHYARIRSARSMVDDRPPTSYKHLKTQAKRVQLLEGNAHTDRYTEIERENRILLEKMKCGSSFKQLNQKRSPAKSLNLSKRRRDLDKINAENEAMLKRLRQKRSSYSVYQWEEDRRANEKRLKIMCAYPYKLNTKRSGFFRKPSTLIYKRGVSIDGKYFIVEIKKSEGLKVIAYDTDSPDTYTLNLTAEQAYDIIGKNEDYDALTSLLQVEDGNLILTYDYN